MKSKISYLTFFVLLTFSAVSQNFADMNYKTFITQQKSISTSDGLSISYIDEGIGDPILLIHGVPTSSWLYRKVIDSLKSKGKRVIIPDLIGFGQSDKPKDTIAYTYDQRSNRLFEFMDSLKIEQWTQVCHDMGSLVTWKMIDNDTLNKISKLVVLNSILEEQNFNPPMKFKKNFFGRTYSKIYCSNLGKGMIKVTLNKGMYKQKIDHRSLHGYVAPLKRSGHHALYQFFTDFDTAYKLIENSKQRLANYNGEILFIWGMHDEILTYQQINNVIDTNQTNIKIITLENSSHFIQEQELINQLVF